ncbi:MAG TPA: phosphatase PAP2 family protein [Chthoniobacteraceae bacterium]|nr:phosphatase PAP2 family protein [Chthoniobacteraceae bacterium]
MSSLNFWAVPILVTMIAVAFYGKFRGRVMLVALVLTIIVSDSIVGDSLKHLIKRPRPNEVVGGVRIVALNLHHPIRRLSSLLDGHVGKEKWVVVRPSRPDPDNARGRSFPSDHTLNNVCAAMVLTFFYRRFGWLFFFPAALVGYSRIYVGSHWPSDVLISFIMGIGLSLLLLAGYEAAWQKIGPRWMPRLYKDHPSLA